MEIKGKNALVTGGAIRIGKAISSELAKHGVNIALHYHSSVDSAIALKPELESEGIRVGLFQQDLSETEALPAFFSHIIETFGQIDILINNAGIYPRDRLKNLKIDTLEALFGINLYAPLVLMREFAKQIPEDGHGKIINIIDAKIFKHDPETFMYRLSKVALWEATKLAAMELAPNITVNAISPG